MTIAYLICIIYIHNVFVYYIFLHYLLFYLIIYHIFASAMSGYASWPRWRSYRPEGSPGACVGRCGLQTTEATAYPRAPSADGDLTCLHAPPGEGTYHYSSVYAGGKFNFKVSTISKVTVWKLSTIKQVRFFDSR